MENLMHIYVPSDDFFKVPTQIAFSNSLCSPCPTANFPCANLRDL